MTGPPDGQAEPERDRLIRLIATALNVDLSGVRPAGGGQGRAFCARSAGEAVIVKWGRDPDLHEKIPYVAGQVPELRRRGCPAPRIIAHGPLGGFGYGWVQERLAGTPAATLDDVLLHDLTDLIARLAGAPAGPHRSDMASWVPAVVFDDLAGWWRTAAPMGPDADAFCARLRAWAGPSWRRLLTRRHDYVHGDLNLSNVLVAGGRLAAVVDTENLGVGDRSVDVARLAFEWYRLARAGVPGLAADGLSRLVALGHAIGGEAGWRVAVACELIGSIGWRSEHETRLEPLSLLPACAGFLDAMQRY